MLADVLLNRYLQGHAGHLRREPGGVEHAEVDGCGSSNAPNITVYPFEKEPDPDGDIALSYGANYYIEGMSYTDSEDHETRIHASKLPRYSTCTQRPKAT